MDEHTLLAKLEASAEKLEGVVERFLDARDAFSALVEEGNPDRRQRKLARDRLLDRAIDIESAATEIEQLMRQDRDSAD
ncbi:MAG: hypothetical protein GEU28_03640 [Dehalococcoidia bacterium]|nr:hypothetical protein [Dehalococcoidia bacterium]